MAWGNLGHEAAGSPSSIKKFPGYAYLPDGVDDTVINDTIFLPDVSFALPDRSITRRRAFQELQVR